MLIGRRETTRAHYFNSLFVYGRFIIVINLWPFDITVSRLPLFETFRALMTIIELGI